MVLEDDSNISSQRKRRRDSEEYVTEKKTKTRKDDDFLASEVESESDDDDDDEDIDALAAKVVASTDEEDASEVEDEEVNEDVSEASEDEEVNEDASEASEDEEVNEDASEVDEDASEVAEDEEVNKESGVGMDVEIVVDKKHKEIDEEVNKESGVGMDVEIVVDKKQKEIEKSVTDNEQSQLDGSKIELSVKDNKRREQFERERNQQNDLRRRKDEAESAAYNVRALQLEKEREEKERARELVSRDEKDAAERGLTLSPIQLCNTQETVGYTPSNLSGSFELTQDPTSPLPATQDALSCHHESDADNRIRDIHNEFRLYYPHFNGDDESKAILSFQFGTIPFMDSVLGRHHPRLEDLLSICDSDLFMKLVHQARDLLSALELLSLDQEGEVINAKVDYEGAKYLRNTMIESTLIQVVLLPIVVCWFPTFAMEPSKCLYLTRDCTLNSFKIVKCGAGRGTNSTFWQVVPFVIINNFVLDYWQVIDEV